LLLLSNNLVPSGAPYLLGEVVHSFCWGPRDPQLLIRGIGFRARASRRSRELRFTEWRRFFDVKFDASCAKATWTGPEAQHQRIARGSFAI
jgi:hypothetical protein